MRVLTNLQLVPNLYSISSIFNAFLFLPYLISLSLSRLPNTEAASNIELWGCWDVVVLVEGVVESVCSIGSAVVLLSKERSRRVREVKNNINELHKCTSAS